MSRDYQGEYNSLYKEYLEYTETVDESIKDQTDMNKFYSEYILKYQSKRDYVVDYMNKIVSDAKAEGIKIKERPIKYYKIKRSESMDENLDIEERSPKIKDLKTVEECEKSINDNNKKIAKLEDEIALLQLYIQAAEKKKRELKAKKGNRSEESIELDIEERALNTEEDYQKAYDKIVDELEAISKRAESINDKYESDLDMLAKAFSKKQLEGSKLNAEAYDKGFKLKSGSWKSSGYRLLQFRSEASIDLETRKQEVINKLTNLEERKADILDNLEYRALKTREDYQKAYDDAKSNYAAAQRAIDKIEEEYERQIEKANTWKIKAYEASNRLTIKYANIMFDLINEAKSKGFKIKN